jgi:hypothetical protein
VLKTVTLKLSPHLKARIAREARQRGKTLDRWILDAVGRELERRERFLSYVKRAERAGFATDPVAELDARQQMRYFLDQLSTTHPGAKVTRLRPRSKVTRLR